MAPTEASETVPRFVLGFNASTADMAPFWSALDHPHGKLSICGGPTSGHVFPVEFDADVLTEETGSPELGVSVRELPAPLVDSGLAELVLDAVL